MLYLFAVNLQWIDTERVAISKCGDVAFFIILLQSCYKLSGLSCWTCCNFLGLQSKSIANFLQNKIVRLDTRNITRAKENHLVYIIKSSKFLLCNIKKIMLPWNKLRLLHKISFIWDEDILFRANKPYYDRIIHFETGIISASYIRQSVSV